MQGKRKAGVLVPSFALRRRTDHGVGDTLAIMEAIDFAQRNEIKALQILPTNETNDDNSPYGAISSVAQEPVLLTMEPTMVPGLLQDHLDALDGNLLTTLRQASHVNYRAVKPLKLGLLERAYDRFVETGDRKDDFERFQHDNSDWLPLYSLFRAFSLTRTSNWEGWEHVLQDPHSAQEWLNSNAERKQFERTRRLREYVQWVADLQWLQVRHHADAANVELIGDIPFGVARQSADLWAFKYLFLLEWSGGAPPEPFFDVDEFVKRWGQNWGIGVYNWLKHIEQKYSWWRRRVLQVLRYCHRFRIDHVLGVFRLFGFPWQPQRNHEFTHMSENDVRARTGNRLPQFLPRPDNQGHDADRNRDEGRAILQVLIQAANEVGGKIIAEDLGCVPPYVPGVLNELGLPGFYIPHWKRKSDQDRELIAAANIPFLSVVTWATHDHPTVRQMYEKMVRDWHGQNGHEHWLEVQRLMRFLKMNDQNPPKSFTPELHGAFCSSLLDSPAELAIFMVSDLLGTHHQFNQPGSVGDQNWSQRLEKTLAEYENDDHFGPVIRRFAEAVRRSGR